ncbi:MAG: DUF4421 domain-containing protein [Alloprevotella sp.]|nr:DUF4421 domain-containing protein [Alloprevotella sp.]
MHLPIPKRLLLLSLMLLPAALRTAAQADVPAAKADTTREEADTLLLPGDSVAWYDEMDDDAFRINLRTVRHKLKKTVRKLDRYDHDYIEPNHCDWTVMAQNTNFLQIVGISGKGTDDVRRTIDFSPRPSYKIGPYIGWRWIFLGFTIDASRPKRAGKMTELNFSLYSSMIGGDFVFVRNSGDFSIRNVYGFDDVERTQFNGTTFSGLSTYTFSANAYYVFNHKRFSYPAAYNQSTVQKRSAGSFILGFRFDRQRINFNYDLLPDALREDDVADTRLDFKNLAYHSYTLNAGYAYNWVPARNLLLAVSLTPALGYKHRSGESITGRKVLNSMRSLSFDFIGRAGFVWNNGAYFAGTSLISQMYDYRRDHFSVVNSVNYLNFYAGFYFGLKKKWRDRKAAEEP